MPAHSSPERDGVVIDVDPQRPEPPPAPPEPPRPVKTGRAAAWFAVVLALLSLLAVVGALLFGLQYWQAVKRDLGLLDAELRETAARNQALQATVSEAAIRVSEQQRQVEDLSERLKQTFDRQREALEHQQTALQRQAEDLADRKLRQDERESLIRTTVADLHRRLGSDDSAWIAAEAGHLLRLADQRLRLARDVGTARSALRLADRRLRATGDPRWSGVRERIARRLVELDQIELPDLSGLSARLSALIEAVPELRLAAMTTDEPAVDEAPDVEPAEPAEPASTSESSGWRAALDELREGLRSTIRIQRRDQPVRPLPSAGLRGLLYQNLELNLEGARLALVGGGERLYRDSLANALAALEQHFDPSDPRVQAMRAELEALAVVDIRPPLPELSDTLRALQAEQELQRSVLEVPVKAASEGAAEPVPAGDATEAGDRTPSETSPNPAAGPGNGETTP